MLNSKILIISLALLLSLLGGGYFFYKSQYLGKAEQQVITEEMSPEEQRVVKILNNDVRVLNQKDSEDHLVYGALTRLAELRGDKGSLGEALKRKSHESKIIRAAVAKALAHYEDSRAEEVLFNYIENDQSEDVRAQAIESLSLKPSLAKSNFLIALVQKTDELSAKEQVELAATALRLSPDEKIKKRMTQHLLKLARQSNDDGLKAAKMLVRLTPSFPETIKFFIEIVRQGKPLEQAKLGINYLASIKSPWIIKYYSYFLNNKSDDLKSAAVANLNFACPENRYQVISKVFQQKITTPMEVSLSQVIPFIASAKMLATLRSLSHKKLNQKAQKILDAQIILLESGKGRDMCSN